MCIHYYKYQIQMFKELNRNFKVMNISMFMKFFSVYKKIYIAVDYI